MPNYSFDGTEGKPIDLATAKQWAANYRTKNPGATEAHFFGHDIVGRILAEATCLGIRVYYAIDDKGNRQLLVVGADSAGDNLLPSADGSGNEIADYSYPCPTYCASNAL